MKINNCPKTGIVEKIGLSAFSNRIESGDVQIYNDRTTDVILEDLVFVKGFKDYKFQFFFWLTIILKTLTLKNVVLYIKDSSWALRNLANSIGLRKVSKYGNIYYSFPPISILRRAKHLQIVSLILAILFSIFTPILFVITGSFYSLLMLCLVCLCLYSSYRVNKVFGEKINFYLHSEITDSNLKEKYDKFKKLCEKRTTVITT